MSHLCFEYNIPNALTKKERSTYHDKNSFKRKARSSYSALDYSLKSQKGLDRKKKKSGVVNLNELYNRYLLGSREYNNNDITKMAAVI